MNKKIVMSLSVIAAVAAVVIGGTSAFFSDTETSTGNTFTAGAIDLQVDSTAVYNGQPVSAATWALKDLVPTADKFFNFSDVKPGDTGSNSISLHVINNDAWVCASISNLVDADNTLTEPESSVDTDGLLTGEMQENMAVTIWRDNGAGGGTAGNNVQDGSEPTLYTGAPQAGTWALYDSTTGTPLPGGSTGYVGVAWTLPLATGNEVQTDSLTGDISFSVVQSRNNGSFKCSDVTGPTVAASYATGFEPSTFSVGNINGQDGWKKTGPYDAAVVASPVIANLQSLRISNAVTSGAFGDQTFAPELASGAGETGVNHFEAEFKIATTQATQQPGLALSVSPDDGNGSRMSYLSFADEASGVRVTFYDVTNAGPTVGTVTSWNPTDLGLLDRSTSHTIKFVMDFVAGPANDIVKIYIDGSLVKTGTSWEDYFRYDSEQTGNGNNLFPVDTLIFRAAGPAVPANLNNGFLFDNVSLSSSSI